MRHDEIRTDLAAVIFDFDGTILDTETPAFEAWREAYARRGAVLDLELWRGAIGSHGAFDPCAHLAELTGRPVDPDEIRAEVRPRARELNDRELLPGVEARLDEARELGLALAVASSSSSAWVETWLEDLGLDGRFACVCGRDHVERVKPAPDLFLLAARRLGAEPAACLVFEDSPNGVLAARSAGMRCVAVPNAMTRESEFPGAELVLESMADMDLGEMLGRLRQGSWYSATT